MDIYAPIPDYDQTVEYITQAEPVAQENGDTFYDVAINPISLDDQDLTKPQTVEVLAAGYENVASLGRDVSQDDIDTLQTASDDSKASTVQATAIDKSLNSIDADSITPSENIPSPVIINPKLGNDMAKPSQMKVTI